MTPDDYLPLSALQHYAFCPRQCALIHVERQWVENRYTAEGRAMHQRADRISSEKRRCRKTVSSVNLLSHRLRLSGIADIVEYEKTGPRWQPYPVEYKRGKPKKGNHDAVQLCAQAIALEEMHDTDIPEGALFYGKTRRRQNVPLTPALRQQTSSLADALHEMFANRRTPEPEPGPKCRHCSFLNQCLPNRLQARRSTTYHRSLFEVPEPPEEA